MHRAKLKPPPAESPIMTILEGEMLSGERSRRRYPCRTSWKGRGKACSGARRYVIAAVSASYSHTR